MLTFDKCKVCASPLRYGKYDGLCELHFVEFDDTEFAQKAYELISAQKPESCNYSYTNPIWHVAIDEWLESR